MGIGRVLGAAAPIAAGYFGGPAMAGFTGGATSGAIAAGALTGAGIAALSGQDMLGGAVTGGLSGMGGGSLRGATDAAKLTASGVGGGTTAGVNAGLQNVASANLAQAGLPQNLGMMSTPGATLGSGSATVPGLQGSIGPNMGMINRTPPVGPGTGMTAAQGTSGLESGGGYTFKEFEKATLPSGTTDIGISDIAGQLGKDDKTGELNPGLGYAKMGLTASAPIMAALYEDDDETFDEQRKDKYDPNSQLDLSMDTGIGSALDRDTGLRLLAKGGHVQKFAMGGQPKAEYTDSQLSSLAEYGVVPQYKAPLGIGASQSPTRVPVKGIVDVGGKFVSDPKGDITDVEFVEKYNYILDADKNKKKQGSGAPMMSSNNAGAGNIGAGASQALAGLAKGVARSQQSQAGDQINQLGGLASGGYLETGGRVGDGMSDDIKATINNSQPARLSDGEFVIPADVVSHLGNGSSDAGAERLYSMMDKVRQARTGNKKQGKEINPERYMPV